MGGFQALCFGAIHELGFFGSWVVAPDLCAEVFALAEHGFDFEAREAFELGDGGGIEGVDHADGEQFSHFVNGEDAVFSGEFVWDGIDEFARYFVVSDVDAGCAGVFGEEGVEVVAGEGVAVE